MLYVVYSLVFELWTIEENLWSIYLNIQIIKLRMIFMQNLNV